MNLEQARGLVKAAVREAAGELNAIGEYIWKNPEPGYREKKTSAKLVEELTKLGLEVKTGLALTGFRADIDTGRPGPTVAVVGELDSLIIPGHPECDPETGAVHSCGHHVSGTSLVGTAIGLLRSGVLDSLCGKIALIGAPSEEGTDISYLTQLMDEGRISSISGKSQLIREGVFDDVDLSFMQHSSTKFGYNDHNGSTRKMITFRGKSCHAARPQGGVNALNASTLALNAIAFLRETYSNDPYVRIHGIISRGGDAVNVVPDTVEMDYMLRAPSVEAMLRLNEEFDRSVLYAAKAVGCEAEIRTVCGFMPLWDNKALGDVAADAVEYFAPGAVFCHNDSFYASCTDMGDVATIVPAVHLYLPCSSGTAHGTDFRISDPDMAFVGAGTLNALIVTDLLFGDGAKACEIAADRKGLMTPAEYLKTVEKLNCTVSTAGL